MSEAVALADRVVLIEDHHIALDESIALARPRSRGNPAFAALEERVLQRVLGEAVQAQPVHVALHAVPEAPPQWLMAM